MNLQLLCKINAVVIGINGLSALLMYNMWFNMAGIEATGPTIHFASHWELPLLAQQLYLGSQIVLQVMRSILMVEYLHTSTLLLPYLLFII